MKDKSTKHISISEHLILLGIGVAVLYWILESAMDAFVFHEGTISERIIGAGLNEIWMRVLIMGIIIIFAVYAQVAIARRKKIEETLLKQRYDLGERVKELECLYGISDLVKKRHISLPEILQGAVDLISPAWQYPEITCARIILRDEEFKTDNFRETAWKQAVDIVVHDKQIGTLEVCYLEERPERDEGPFLKEERLLINSIVEQLGGIIDHKEAEEEITWVARDLRQIIETVNVPIIGVDVKGLLNEWNQKAVDITGYSREEVLGRSFIEDFIGDDYKALLQEVLDKTLKGEETASVEFALKTKDGQQVTILFNATSRRDASGNIIGVFGIGQDISERKKIEQMKSDFVALASHELRTPLTSIQGYAELILDGDVGEISREQREFLEIISQNTRRLEALINDVLDVEKIESGRMTMKREKVDLSQIVDSCVNTFKVMAEGKGLQLEKDVKTSPINVSGDSDRLSQVFSNLLSNAIKYTKEGRVKISARIKGKFASVAVEDTGLGMSPEDMKIVFSRFFRAEDSYVRKTTGSGLGLSIAKATIERHNGDIKVESKLGAGSKFKVVLPLFKEKEGAGQ